MNKFFVAIIFFPLSFALIIYREKIKQFTGSIAFAETYLGSGGTYTLFIILGILTFVVTLMYLTGTIQSMLSTVFGPLLFTNSQP